MNKIDGYSVYQNLFDSKALNSKPADTAEKKTQSTAKGWNQDAVRMEQSSKAENKSGVSLSDAAQKLLEELREKYSNMDFMVADYSSEEEAQELLSRGTKEYSVLMDPETLEKMAADEEVKAKYIGIIDQSTAKLDEVKDELKESGQDVTRIGFTVDDSGTVSFFAELEKSSKAQNERLEASREKKRTERKEEEKKVLEEKKQEKEDGIENHRRERAQGMYHSQQQGVKKTVVTAATTDELLEKIRNIDWNQISEAVPAYAGTRIDFSI